MAAVDVARAMYRYVRFSLSGLLVMSAVVGCQRSKQADYSSLGLVNVTGIVRLDGQPLVGATVVFENENGTFSAGTTDASGRYRLMYNSEQAGIAPGKKTVRITSRSLDESEQPAGSKRDSIPARYNSQSQETVEVTAGNAVFDFDLTSSP